MRFYVKGFYKPNKTMNTVAFIIYLYSFLVAIVFGTLGYNELINVIEYKLLRNILYVTVNFCAMVIFWLQAWHWLQLV